MTIPAQPPLRFDFFAPLPTVVEACSAPLTSDAGLLPLRQFDERIGLSAQFAAALHDPRDPRRVEHSFLEGSWQLAAPGALPARQRARERAPRGGASLDRLKRRTQGM
jgi:hypothetical protein